MTDILILVGPSAVGKTTVMHRILDMADRFMPLRSMTTRPERFAGDSEYLHVSEEDFAAAVARGELLEHMRYGSYSYGTPRAEMARAEAAGKCPLLILDLVGARALKRSDVGERVYTVYLYEALDVLERRLRLREGDAPTPEGLLRIERRVMANVRDYLSLSDYTGALDVLIDNRPDPHTVAEGILRALAVRYTDPPAEREAQLSALRAEAQRKQNYRA